LISGLFISIGSYLNDRQSQILPTRHR